MFRSIVLLVGGLASLSTASLLAQNAVLGQKYGQGVHDYFAGNSLKAYEQLTAAVEGGSKDPRVYYFRGLAYLKLGRGPEASQDFRKGSELETSDVNKFYNVSKALERVQGSARVNLECYRVDARMAAMERAAKLRKARYEAIEREESRVLRKQSLAPAEPIQTPEPAAELDLADPFATGVQKPETKAAGKTVEAPAAGPAKPAKKKSGGVLGAMGKALGKAIAGENDDPFAEEKPADAADPFGEAPEEEEEPANPDDPFAL